MTNYYANTPPPKDNYVIISIDSQPFEIDPQNIQDYTGGIICQSLFEPLFTFDPNSDNLISNIVDHYTISEDNELYTFYLYKNRKWSNGELITAYDCQFTIQRLVSSGYQKELALPIENAEEIIMNQKDVSCLGVNALNAHILTIKLAHPLPHLLHLLTNSSFSPVSQKCIETHGSEWIMPKNIISSGPYILNEFNKKNIIVKKNPRYFNSNKKRISGIKFLLCNNFDEQLHLYKAGKIHITCNTLFPYKEIPHFKQYTDFHIQPLAMLQCLFLNMEKPLFQDINVRKLLYHSIDKRLICKNNYNGIIEINGFIPYGIHGYNHQNPSNIVIPQKDKAAQKKLDSKTFEIIYADYYPNKKIVNSIANMWSNALGLTIVLKKIPLEEIPKRLSNNDFDSCFSLIPADFDNPFSYFQNYATPCAFNLTKYTLNDYIDQLSILIYMDKALQREKKIKDIEGILFETLPIIPLFSSQSIFLKKPYISNFSISPTGTFLFSNMDISTI